MALEAAPRDRRPGRPAAGPPAGRARLRPRLRACSSTRRPPTVVDRRAPAPDALARARGRPDGARARSRRHRAGPRRDRQGLGRRPGRRGIDDAARRAPPWSASAGTCASPRPTATAPGRSRVTERPDDAAPDPVVHARPRRPGHLEHAGPALDARRRDAATTCSTRAPAARPRRCGARVTATGADLRRRQHRLDRGHRARRRRPGLARPRAASPPGWSRRDGAVRTVGAGLAAPARGERHDRRTAPLVPQPRHRPGRCSCCSPPALVLGRARHRAAGPGAACPRFVTQAPAPQPRACSRSSLLAVHVVTAVARHVRRHPLVAGAACRSARPTGRCGSASGTRRPRPDASWSCSPACCGTGSATALARRAPARLRRVGARASCTASASAPTPARSRGAVAVAAACVAAVLVGRAGRLAPAPAAPRRPPRSRVTSADRPAAAPAVPVPTRRPWSARARPARGLADGPALAGPPRAGTATCRARLSTTLADLVRRGRPARPRRRRLPVRHASSRAAAGRGAGRWSWSTSARASPPAPRTARWLGRPRTWCSTARSRPPARSAPARCTWCCPGDRPRRRGRGRAGLAERRDAVRRPVALHEAAPRFVAGQARAVLELMAGRAEPAGHRLGARGGRRAPRPADAAVERRDLGARRLPCCGRRRRLRRARHRGRARHDAAHARRRRRGGSARCARCAYGTPPGRRARAGGARRTPLLVGGFHGTWAAAGDARRPAGSTATRCASAGAAARRGRGARPAAARARCADRRGRRRTWPARAPAGAGRAATGCRRWPTPSARWLDAARRPGRVERARRAGRRGAGRLRPPRRHGAAGRARCSRRSPTRSPRTPPAAARARVAAAGWRAAREPPAAGRLARCARRAGCATSCCRRWSTSTSGATRSCAARSPTSCSPTRGPPSRVPAAGAAAGAR